MSIWKSPINLEEAARIRKNTMVDTLGIEFIEIGEDFLSARMPVDHRTIQPYGIMHGGASCVLAETVASVAANYCVDNKSKVCVGLEINTNHIRSIKKGWVIGTARPLHLGKSTQVWDVKIIDEMESLISVTRITIAVIDRKID